MQANSNYSPLPNQSNPADPTESTKPSTGKKSTGLNIPAVALLAAIKQHYLSSVEVLVTVGRKTAVSN